MNYDLKDQIRELTDFIETSQTQIQGPDVRATAAGLTSTVDKTSLRRKGVLIAVSAFVLVLILVGGMAWLVPLGDNAPPANEPTVTTTMVPTEDAVESLEPPRLTENIPPGLESGILDTSVGDARWVRLTGDVSSLPRGEALLWPTGFAIFERPQVPVFDVRLPARLWVSPDGVEWRVEPIPAPDDAEDVSLTLVDGEYWLLSVNPNRLWRSSDGATWEEYDLSGLAPPGPAGFNMRMEGHTGPVKAGDLTVLYVQYVGLFPAEAFGIPRQCTERPLRLEPGVYQMTGDEECPQGGPVLRFIETETGLQVLDNATGEVLGEILEADLTHIETMAETDELRVESLFIIGDGEVTRAEKPWPRSSGSDDGAEFGVVPPGRPDDTNPVRLESGWFATDGSIGGPSDGDAWWMYVDGTWISLVDLGMERPEPDCIVSATATETTTFFFGGPCFFWDSNARNVWVLSLEPSN